jgi:hypothetical protein
MAFDYDLVNITETPLHWSFLRKYNAVMLQRPQSNHMIGVAKMAQELKIPIWIDYDDDILNISRGHPSQAFYQGIRNFVVEMVKMASVVTVSTMNLAESLSAYCSPVVVPNALPEKMFTHRVVPADGITLYRGSPHHMADLYEHREFLQRYIDKEGIYFMGVNPFFLRGYHIHLDLELTEYFKFLPTVGASKVICPLIDNAFNRSKSNNAWLEATYMGAVCFATMLPEFQMPGVVPIDDLFESFEPEDLQMFYDTSFEYIMDNLTVEKVNLIRVEALKNL